MSGKNTIVNTFINAGYSRYQTRAAGIIANPRVSLARANYDNAKQAFSTKFGNGSFYAKFAEKHPKTVNFLETVFVYLPNKIMGRKI